MQCCVRTGTCWLWAVARLIKASLTVMRSAMERTDKGNFIPFNISWVLSNKEFFKWIWAVKLLVWFQPTDSSPDSLSREHFKLVEVWLSGKEKRGPFLELCGSSASSTGTSSEDAVTIKSCSSKIWEHCRRSKIDEKWWPSSFRLCLGCGAAHVRRERSWLNNTLYMRPRDTLTVRDD